MSTETPAFVHIPFQQMFETFRDILLQHGFENDKAITCAKVFTDNSVEGVYTHGVNRFTRFIQYITAGEIDVAATPSIQSAFNGLEQWNGNIGPGPLNALFCTDRAITLSRLHGLGCVALSNTNHWMRGGTYGWRAATAGYVFIGWTNTTANMPAWGAVEAKLGNNPLVLAMPYKKSAIVLDMAMSQYSYGALDLYHQKKESLPVPGGYDTTGALTTNPNEIITSRRVLPIGFWKGAGLSLLLDILATVLSGGQSTAQISKQKNESRLSQVFIAIDISKLGNYPLIEQSIQEIINDYHTSKTADNQKPAVHYPGEFTSHKRDENTQHGIPVLKRVWEEIIALKTTTP